jgi:hypothetical protein
MQQRGTLVNVLFEPVTELSDSVTYDITAWALPYAYGLQAIASKAAVPFHTHTLRPLVPSGPTGMARVPMVTYPLGRRAKCKAGNKTHAAGHQAAFQPSSRSSPARSRSTVVR